MSERIIAAVLAAAMFAIVGLFVSEWGQSRIAGVFPKGMPHYVYKRAALTALIMAIAGVQGAMRLPVIFGFDDPAKYKAIQFDSWQAVLFILILCVFFTPFAISRTAPFQTGPGSSARNTSVDIELEDEESADDGWEDAQVLSVDEVLNRAKRTNEIHIGRGTAARGKD